MVRTRNLLKVSLQDHPCISAWLEVLETKGSMSPPSFSLTGKAVLSPVHEGINYLSVLAHQSSLSANPQWMLNIPRYRLPRRLLEVADVQSPSISRLQKLTNAILSQTAITIRIMLQTEARDLYIRSSRTMGMLSWSTQTRTHPRHEPGQSGIDGKFLANTS